MSTLILIGLDDEENARGAFTKIQELHQIALLNLTGAALVAVAKDGHMDVTTTAHDPIAPIGMAQSAAFGLILGSVLTTPLFGFAVGGTLGAVFEKHEQSDSTLDQKFRQQTSKALKPGHWAVVAYATQVADAELARQLESFGGTLISSEITDEEEAQLANEVGVGA
jgi:uncharacterized membrane protein